MRELETGYHNQFDKILNNKIPGHSHLTNWKKTQKKESKIGHQVQLGKKNIEKPEIMSGFAN